MRIQRIAAFTTVCLLLCGSHTGSAYELDSYYQRLQPLADATPLLNREMNRAIADSAAACAENRDERCVINGIFRRVGGYYWVDHLERWAWHSPEIERIQAPRSASIYAGMPVWASRVSYFFEVGPIISVAGQRIGTDKIGHFISQGRKFNRRWRRDRHIERAARWSAFTERGIFGQLTTGDYSNADLVANYEGHRFYRELFEDDIVAGRKAILRRARSGWVMQRDFDWADHVNAYWDEAINTSYYDALLRPWIERHLHNYCNDYVTSPASYHIDRAEDRHLRQRYADLQLRNTDELRLPLFCGGGVKHNEQINPVRQ